jgi:hypothetical protein
LPKTGIDGYGVPVRNGIFANAMISRDRHCHHDAACFLRNAVNAVAVIMRVQRTYTQGYASLTLGFTVPCRWHWSLVNLCVYGRACFMFIIELFQIRLLIF